MGNFQTKSEKPPIFGHFGQKRPNLYSFVKTVKLLKAGEIFIRKFQRAVFEQNVNPLPPHFWAFLAKKANFGQFLAKKGQLSNFRRETKKIIFIGSVHQAKTSRKADFGKFLAKMVKISGKFFLNF